MAHDGPHDWHVPIDPAFLRCGLSARARDVLVAICYRARSRPYAWCSTKDLMTLTGKGRTSVGAALLELERAGWVWRSMAPRRRTTRVGIVLRRRPDAAFWPQADDDTKLAAAMLTLTAERASWLARRRGHAAIPAPN